MLGYLDGTLRYGLVSWVAPNDDLHNATFCVSRQGCAAVSTVEAEVVGISDAT